MPLDVVVVVREIAARILPVGIQEQIVQPTGQVVVVGDIGPGTARRIVLVQMAQPPGDHVERALERPPEGVVDIEGTDTQEVVQGALLDRQLAVHVGFAEIEIGVDRKPVVQRLVVQPDRRNRTILATDHMAIAVRVDDRQPSRLDHLSGKPSEEHPTKSSH